MKPRLQPHKSGCPIFVAALSRLRWAFAKRTFSSTSAQKWVPHVPNLGRGIAQCFLTLLFFTTAAPAQTVVKLTLHDTVQPVSAAYLQRGLEAAAAQHADAVLLSLGTPGGLLSSTREMVSAIELSPVPVIIFIEPTGARAGSAGFFLLEAGDIAAMAPGTNAGAAHPIIEGTTLDPILKKKVEEDASAFLRSIATPRHRDSVAGTAAIIDAKSYTADEALKLHLIDVIAPDEQSLLAQLDNRTITRFNGSATTLHLRNAHIQNLPPSQRERLLTRLADPDFAVLLFIVGALLIYLEFNVPGTVVPGVLGVLCVLLALFAFNLLPISHTAVLLLIAALALILLEVKFSSHGLLALVGTICLVFGLLTLVDGPPELRVHTSTALAAGLTFGVITFVLAWLGLKARRNKSLTGPGAMLGLLATVRSPLEPLGQVLVRGEIWQAVLAPDSGPVSVEQQTVVAAVNGLTLTVRALPPKV
jgi:membrane-bound serine protease (ClpP class)